MSVQRFVSSLILGAAFAAGLAVPAGAAELVYGSWLPAREYQNAKVMPELFRQIEKDTNGQVKWRLIPGGQVADGKGTFAAVQNNVMQAGLAIASYLPSAVPSVYVLYSSVIPGHDVVAASAAALEVMTLHCPSCNEEAKKANAVLLAGWVAAPYQLLCREPVQSAEQIKGKRIRATGGTGEELKTAGAVVVSGTLVEAVSLLQRGGLDCVLGNTDWLRTLGYADFTKYVTDHSFGMVGPAVGFYMNRDAWNKLTPEQKQVHLRASARMSAEMAIGSFIVSNEQSLEWAMKNKGVKVVKGDASLEKLTNDYVRAQREHIVKQGKELGVADPGAIYDAYIKAYERWRPLSKQIGRDAKKFEAAIMREIYAKVDPAKL
ncbi:MAG TPA: TRAP transporter substrate-binding protein DctP [Burkholderiales bacterium]